MSNRGGSGWILALAVALACQGCVVGRGEYLPAVPEHPGAVVAGAEASPRMRWVIHHSHSGEAETGQLGMAGAKTHTDFKRALEGLQPEMPFLAHASFDEADPEYVLALYTAVEERGALNAALSGLTLGVIPWYMRSEVRVMAALQTLEGENLVTHQSTQQIRGISQILLVLALPWTLTRDFDDVYANSLRSAIDAVAQDYAHLRTTAAGR